MRRRACLVALAAFVAAGALALQAGEDHLSLVPWKVLEPGEAVDAPLVLFWVPLSPDEVRHSPLLTSDELTLYSSRCVAMRVIRVDDGARLANLGVSAQLPVAVLAESGGHVITAIESDRGTLSVADVEDAVREELDARTEGAQEKLDQAQRLADDGDVGEAAALYRQVWEERCVCPREGRAAQKALRRLEKK